MARATMCSGARFSVAAAARRCAAGRLLRTDMLSSGQDRRRAAGLDRGAHDPPPLSDLPNPREAVSRIQLLRSCMQIGATLRRPLLGLLWIGLDDTAASPLDLVECRRDRGGGDAPAAVLRVGEDAADPPVRQLSQALFVGLGVFDGSHFGRWSELAPADAALTVVDEHLVDRSAHHMPTLQLPVCFAPVADALRVESNAPATTPDAVVSLDERSEVVPGLRREHPSRQRHTHSVAESSDMARFSYLQPVDGGDAEKARWLGRDPSSCAQARSRKPCEDNGSCDALRRQHEGRDQLRRQMTAAEIILVLYWGVVAAIWVFLMSDVFAVTIRMTGEGAGLLVLIILGWRASG